MRIAYFDCFSGISGDMILGALVDAGLDVGALRRELDKLGVPGFELEATRVERHGISGTQVRVLAAPDHEHRGLRQIRALLDDSGISESSKVKAKKVFERLADAEAKVHGTVPDQVRFHEVGAVDAIVDIVGAVMGLELLGVERVFASPLRLGTGLAQGAHGTIPIPSPATLELTRGVPIERTGIAAELVTPTGAALITTLAGGYGAAPQFVTQAIGYGAGSRTLKEIPNLLRVQIGEQTATFEEDHSVVVETNIDDMNPQVYAYVLERLFQVGAKDAYLTSVMMKKARPGVLLTVLTDPASVDAVVQTVFEETTTLGVRIWRVDRRKLTRSAGQVQTPYGPVATKIAHFEGRLRQTPEYEDCAKLARQCGVPVLEVYKAAQCSQETPAEGGH